MKIGIGWAGQVIYITTVRLNEASNTKKRKVADSNEEVPGNAKKQKVAAVHAKKKKKKLS
jgi:hypothetical protein